MQVFTASFQDGVTCVLEASRVGRNDILEILFDYNGSATAAANAAREAKRNEQKQKEGEEATGGTNQLGLAALGSLASPKIISAKIDKVRRNEAGSKIEYGYLDRSCSKEENITFWQHDINFPSDHSTIFHDVFHQEHQL